MTTRLITRIVSLCLILLTYYSLVSCDNNVQCQSPPQEIAIQIMDGTLTYPADLDTTAQIRVSFQKDNQKKYITELRRQGDVFWSNILIEESHRNNNPELSFELNDRVLSKMQMETYINNAKCNGWANIAKVHQNGVVVTKSVAGTYILK